MMDGFIGLDKFDLGQFFRFCLGKVLVILWAGFFSDRAETGVSGFLSGFHES